MKFFLRVEAAKKKYKSIAFHKIPREANSMADGLAKLGVDREQPLLAWLFLFHADPLLVFFVS